MLVEKVTGYRFERGDDALAREQAAEHEVMKRRGVAADASAHKPMTAPPVLARPVLMVPGLTMAAASFDPMTTQLASTGKNGVVAVYCAADGQFHAGDVAGPVLTGAALAKVKMFQLEYVDPNAGPSQKQAQVGQALAAIQAATGAATVDMVAHSAGGTDVRLYLEQRQPGSGPTIGETVLIGPASHGTFMGDVGDKIGKPLGLKQAGAELAMHSPLIDMLNRRWAHQRGQISGHITIIAVGGAPTVGAHGLTDGDGYMPVNEASMPGADTIVLQGFDKTPVAHLREVEYSGVIEEVQQALARGAVTPGRPR